MTVMTAGGSRDKRTFGLRGSLLIQVFSHWRSDMTRFLRTMWTLLQLSHFVTCANLSCLRHERQGEM